MSRNDLPERGSATPGSQTALRRRNIATLLEALREGGPATQAELARRTGFSGATVSNLVRRMAQAGAVDLEPTISSGRRATLVRLASDGSVVVGIDFGRRHVRVVVVSTGHHVLAEQTVPLRSGEDAAVALAAAKRLVSSLLEAAEVDRKRIVGYGVGIPGPLDLDAGVVGRGGILPEWTGLPLSELEAEFDPPVVIDNDANLGAIAEVTWGAARGVRDLLFIKVGTGIGTGLILGGRPYVGDSGIAGEIGHTLVVGGGPCTCGRRGCLETVASTAAMLRRVGEIRHGEVDLDDLVRWCYAGDEAVLGIVAEAASALGRAVGAIANLLGPRRYVIGGPLAGLGEIYLAPFRTGMEETALEAAVRNASVSVSSLGERAEALGAAARVLQSAEDNPLMNFEFKS